MIYLDLHTHTIVSGHAYSTLNENIAAAKQHGLKIYGISDHAPKMPGSTHLFYFRNLHVVPDTVQGIRVLKARNSTLWMWKVMWISMKAR